MDASSNSKTFKYILQIASVYLIVIWAISGADYLFGVFDTLVPNKDSFSLIGSVAGIFFSGLMIWSNIYLIFYNKKNMVFKYLNLNKWVNFLQILNLSIFGFFYHIIIGSHFLGYYIFDEIQRFSYAIGYFNLTVSVGYINSNRIFLGISLIPLILFYIFDRSIRISKNNPPGIFNEQVNFYRGPTKVLI